MGLKFATGNENKLREARSILGNDLESVKIDMIEIQDKDMLEVVKHKARDGYIKTGEQIMVEDSSLIIESMNGMPGPFIKWYLEGIGLEGIIAFLRNKNRKAKAVAYVVSYDGLDYTIGYGEISGEITDEPRGENGFGWDKIFKPNGSDFTFGEMALEEKNKYSMRKLAFEDFKVKFKQN